MSLKLLGKVDIQLVIPVIILLGIGLTTLFSINGSIFRNQLLFSLLAIGFFLGFAQLDLTQWKSFGKLLYIAAILCLGLVLLLGIESRGAMRWLDVLGIRIQFSEIFKPFLAVALAAFLAKKNTRFSNFAKVFALLAPIAFLIYKQPDLGSALLYVLSTFLVLLLYGFPLWWFGVILAGVVALIPLVFRFLHAYQQERLLTFFHLSHDPLGTSYNAIQAMIAIGSGMILGKGLGMGTQSGLRFLPERHTDFIFATLSEDLGFIGASVTIIAFLFLFYRLFVILKFSESTFEKVFIAATFSLLFIQFFINIGMNLGIVPIVGVPLPFVSYGGSSLISNAIFLGLASGIGSREQGKSVLEIR